ncbi:insulin-like growth factor-binding protein complex acid labile subunit [Saccostrea echinata]|uniref:insulin-like growth factor-binding protein complex acid labile subunit n=1 Tax=Saccostrea echinata TaxID=191078 RepID=UPI002A81A348|nr:insulin-like growth factor-binding protein complex acid labile subunit [Saccostrea echinata]
MVLTFHGCRPSLSLPEVLNCSFSNLTIYPNDVPSEVKILDLSHNELTNIEILNTTPLTHLNLSNNLIQKIKHNAFTELTNLVHLDLSFNLLKGSDLLIQRYRFELSEFHSLKFLSFRGNPLGLVSRMTFTSHGYLFLEELDLSYCSITTVEAMALTNLVRLKRLYLQYNYLTVFTEDSLRTLGELEELHLEHNKIKTLGVLGFFPQLHTLYLNYNKLETLEGNTISHLNKLENLFIDHNKLKYLTHNTFPNGLKRVFMAGNPWRCDCNMKWILTNPTSKQFFNNNSLLCTHPSRYRGKNILSLEADDLTCMTSAVGVLATVLLTLTIMVLSALGMTVVYKKRQCLPCFKDSSGQYVAVYTMDDGQRNEPSVTISDTKTLVKEVEIYA